MSTRRQLLGFCLSSSLALSAFSIASSGCDKEEVKPEATPIVGTLELPIAHRNGAPEPSDAARVEIGASEIRVAGETVLPLESGKVPAGERPNDVLPKLQVKLGGKKTMALTVYAATPYATLARVINTGLKAGVSEFAFKVRKPGSNKDTGYFTIRDVHFIKSSDDSGFNESALLPWESFTKVWEESLEACQSAQNVDCGYKPMAKAEGGKLDLMLRVRGTGVAIRFRQQGGPPQPEAGVAQPSTATAEAKPEKKKKGKKAKAELLDGIKGGATAEAAEPAPPPPQTEQVFTLRATHASEVPTSPISAIVKPVCGSQSCPTVLEAEGVGMSGNVISLLAAAFPDGTPEPKLAIVLPPP